MANQLVIDISEKCFLKQLELSKLPISPEYLRLLGKFVSESKFLEELDISNNEFEDKAMQDFLKVIVENKKLTGLSLANNQLIVKDLGINQQLLSSSR